MTNLRPLNYFYRYVLTDVLSKITVHISGGANNYIIIEIILYYPSESYLDLFRRPLNRLIDSKPRPLSSLAD